MGLHTYLPDNACTWQQHTGKNMLQHRHTFVLVVAFLPAPSNFLCRGTITTSGGSGPSLSLNGTLLEVSTAVCRAQTGSMTCITQYIFQQQTLDGFGPSLTLKCTLLEVSTAVCCSQTGSMTCTTRYIAKQQTATVCCLKSLAVCSFERLVSISWIASNLI